MLPDALHTPDDHPYASRGGLKLEAALHAFEVDVDGLLCADLGCSTGGFTSCLLRHGAAKVYAVDTAYGELAWPLRQDERVVVMERSNALHTPPPEPPELRKRSESSVDAPETGVGLVTIDLGWTRQAKALPAALAWLGAGAAPACGRIITLIKPHYEQPYGTEGRRKGGAKRSAMPQAQAREVAAQTLEAVEADPALGLRVAGVIDSPLAGGKGGNLELLALLERRV